MFVRVLKIVGILFLLVIFFALISYLQNFLIRPIGGYANCGWLNNVPADWKCDDKKGREGWNLYAENRTNPDQYLIFRTRGHNGTDQFCTPFLPISGVLKANWEGDLAIVSLCNNDGKLFYYANWYHHGNLYELIGRNIPYNLFIANLYIGTSSQTLTIKDSYRVSPTKIKILEDGSYDVKSLELRGTDVCVYNNETQMYTELQPPSYKDRFIKLYPTNQDVAIDILPNKECVVKMTLPENLTPGTYKFAVNLNANRWFAKDEISVN